MMKRLLKKTIGSKKGFSLMELVVCVAILAILVSMVSMGVAFSARVYQTSVFESRSEVLASTLNSALSDVLRYAEYTGETQGTVFFNNSKYFQSEEGVRGSFIMLDNGHLLIYNYTTGDTKWLINSGAYTDFMISDFQMSYDGETQCFQGEYVISREGNEQLTKTVEFAYRSIVTI